MFYTRETERSSGKCRQRGLAEERGDIMEWTDAKGACQEEEAQTFLFPGCDSKAEETLQKRGEANHAGILCGPQEISGDPDLLLRQFNNTQAAVNNELGGRGASDPEVRPSTATRGIEGKQSDLCAEKESQNKNGSYFWRIELWLRQNERSPCETDRRDDFTVMNGKKTVVKMVIIFTLIQIRQNVMLF